jgi:O-antigen ligase
MSRLKKIQEILLYLLPVFLIFGILDYRFHSYFWPRFNVLNFFEFGRFFDFVSIFTVFLLAFLLTSFNKRFKFNKFLLLTGGLVLLGGIVSLAAGFLVEPILKNPLLYFVQIYLLPVLLCMALVSLLMDFKYKSRFENILVISFSVLAAMTILQFMFGFLPGAAQDFMGRAVWPYIDPFSEMKPESANWLAFIYAPMALLGIMKVKDGNRWMLVPSLILFVGLLLSESYGGILTLLILVFVYLFVHVSKKAKYGLITTSLLAMIVLIVTQYNTPKFQALIGNYHMPNSIERRAQIYEYSWKAMHDSFVPGIGLANYQSDFRERQHIYLEESIPELELPPHPHNLIFNFWSDLGLFGLLAILGIYVFAIWNLFKRNWSYLLIAYPLVHGMIDTPYILEETTMMFWILLSLSIVGARKAVLAK